MCLYRLSKGGKWLEHIQRGDQYDLLRFILNGKIKEKKNGTVGKTLTFVTSNSGQAQWPNGGWNGSQYLREL